MVILEFLKRLWSEARAARAAAVERRARLKVALGFNARHTYAGPVLVAGQWMCPSCLKVHECVGWTPFTGREFPACCEHRQGPRLDKAHAIRF